MSAAEEALATLKGFENILLAGAVRQSDIAKVLLGATVNRTIDGASTLSLDVYDDNRKLLTSGAFNEQTRVTLDNFPFELVQVRKSGNVLTLTFEDLVVAVLRRRNTPLKVSANTITHVDFAERLVTEEPWVNFWVPPALRSTVRTKVELARGTPATTDGTKAEEESSWEALGRIGDERGWRRYVMNRDTVAYVPETWLAEQEPSFTLQENSSGVENIDFDFDAGKPVATLKATVRAARWAVSVGNSIEVQGMGLADGRWVVSGVSRSLFSVFVELNLTKARPVLPEPEAPAVALSSPSSTVGSSSSSPGVSSVAVTGGGGEWPNDPSNLVKIGQGNHRLAAPAAESFIRVIHEFGRYIPVTDSYRSVATQAAAIKTGGSARFAKPGSSAHGEGRAVDVNLAQLGITRQSPDPKKWDEHATWKRLNEAFIADGWCNYQYKNGTTKGKTSEPWHWSYRVCK